VKENTYEPVHRDGIVKYTRSISHIKIERVLVSRTKELKLVCMSGGEICTYCKFMHFYFQQEQRKLSLTQCV